MASPTPADIVSRTRKWVGEWIVGLSICPFARPVVEADRLRYAVAPDGDEEARYQYFLAEMAALLDADPAITETTVVIFPEGLADFEDYLDFHALCERALVEVGLEGTFQIATFHPEYIFQGESPDGTSHWTNRSPFPMLHLLREESVTQAVATHPDPEGIPARNIALMEKMGVDEIEQFQF